MYQKEKNHTAMIVMAKKMYKVGGGEYLVKRKSYAMKSTRVNAEEAAETVAVEEATEEELEEKKAMEVIAMNETDDLGTSINLYVIIFIIWLSNISLCLY